MTKAELETDAVEYDRHVAVAERAIARGLYRAALDSALSAWGHVDGMVQFERRFGKREVVSIRAFDLAFKLAPVLLDFRCLDHLEELVRQKRRLSKSGPLALEDRLAEARQSLGDNYRLWSLLGEQGEISQDELSRRLGGDQAKWRRVAEDWRAMGLVNRVRHGNSYLLALATRMGRVVSGKCPKCGEIADAPKSMLLEPLPCPKCSSTVLFVLLKSNE